MWLLYIKDRIKIRKICIALTGKRPFHEKSLILSIAKAFIFNYLFTIFIRKIIICSLCMQDQYILFLSIKCHTWEDLRNIALRSNNNSCIKLGYTYALHYIAMIPLRKHAIFQNINFITVPKSWNWFILLFEAWISGILRTKITVKKYPNVCKNLKEKNF